MDLKAICLLRKVSKKSLLFFMINWIRLDPRLYPMARRYRSSGICKTVGTFPYVMKLPNYHFFDEDKTRIMLPINGRAYKGTHGRRNRDNKIQIHKPRVTISNCCRWWEVYLIRCFRRRGRLGYIYIPQDMWYKFVNFPFFVFVGTEMVFVLKLASRFCDSRQPLWQR